MEYIGESLKLIKEHNIDVYDLLSIITDDLKYEGLLLPRAVNLDDKHIVIKLKNGYNVGIESEKIRKIDVIKKYTKAKDESKKKIEINNKLPRISIISTGGTISSKVDYKTGAVTPILTAEEIQESLPDLAKYANIEPEFMYNISSENINHQHWTNLSERINEKIIQGDKGVIITHGTDTMAYTSAALSFSLSGTPIPIILVGSQRSTDRPSSDGFTNLMGALQFCLKSNKSGVFLAMHEDLNDDRIAIHIGTKARKNHTSSRAAFESINSLPVAYVKGEKIIQNKSNIMKSSEFSPRTEFNEKVSLIKFHPNFNPEIIDFLIKDGYKGIIIEGTGLGHVSSKCFESIKKSTSKAIVCMTSQCLWGRTRMTVYDMGRELLNLGVIPLQDMLPETALVKLMWALGNFHDNKQCKEIMTKNVAMEYSERSLINNSK